MDGGDGGEITLQASKLIHKDAPTITNQATNANVVASQSVSISGTYTDTHAQTENTQSSGTEEDKSSFLAQILNAIKKFQKFYKSLCSD